MSLATLKGKVGQLIEKAQNAGGLPDWDDDSPIIASGIGGDKAGAYTRAYWELTEKGTMRWKYNPQGAGTGSYSTTAGFISSNLNAMKDDYLAIADKVRQIDVAKELKAVRIGYAINCERIRLSNREVELNLKGMPSLKEINHIDNGTNSILLTDCHSLEELTISPTRTKTTAYMCSSLLNLREVNIESLTTFSQNSFSDCPNLKMDVVFNANLVALENRAFQNCGIKTITFRNPVGVLPSVNAYAFNGCTNVTDIYVPWAEGAVANAPWGATNATIHYNAEV